MIAMGQFVLFCGGYSDHGASVAPAYFRGSFKDIATARGAVLDDMYYTIFDGVAGGIAERGTKQKGQPPVVYVPQP
jgi:hypothetical protein